MDALISELDALEVVKGPEPMTCKFWRELSDERRDAIVRNVQRIGHTRVFAHLKASGFRVTTNGIRDHAAGTCSCQTS